MAVITNLKFCMQIDRKGCQAKKMKNCFKRGVV